MDKSETVAALLSGIILSWIGAAFVLSHSFHFILVGMAFMLFLFGSICLTWLLRMIYVELK